MANINYMPENDKAESNKPSLELASEDLSEPEMNPSEPVSGSVLDLMGCKIDLDRVRKGLKRIKGVDQCEDMSCIWEFIIKVLMERMLVQESYGAL